MSSAATRTTKKRPSPRDMPGAAGQQDFSLNGSAPGSNVLRDGPLDIEMLSIDAALAREYLLLNTTNRTLRKRKTNEYVRDMVSGNWRDLGDPIRFDANGDLCDGQHRLTALIEADRKVPGITLPFLVIRGVAVEDRVAIDTGTRRTAADQLKIAGYRNHFALAGAAKWALFWEREQMFADSLLKNVTHPEILAYVDANPPLQDVSAMVMAKWSKKIKMPIIYVTAGYWILSQVDEEDAFEFFDRWADGYDLSRNSPILRLRRKLDTLKDQRVSLSGEMWLSLLFRTWNAVRTGKDLVALPLDKKHPDGTREPVPVPIPV